MLKHMPTKIRPTHTKISKDFYESSDSDETHSPVQLRSKAVFNKNLRRMTVHGLFTRD